MQKSTCLHVPAQPRETLCPDSIIADGLLNPRGISVQADGSLLLIEAGTGHAETPFSGRISRLRPAVQGASTSYLAPEVLVQGYRSMNMQERMLRDEIMGLSDISCVDGHCFASVTDYVEGSKVVDLQHNPPEPVFYSEGNLNALCYHPTRRSWLSVKPDTNQVVEFTFERGEQELVKLPDLEQGQEAVPVVLVYEPATDALLISLFSGEMRQDPSLAGIEFIKGAGQVIRVWPNDGRIEPVITHLQLPTGLAVTPQGSILVLELCNQLLQPLTLDWNGAPIHGGFERFSGRLLHCDLNTGETSVLAKDLDTPSNLCLLSDAVLISEGMGLTGRMIPTPNNEVVPLTGKIRRVTLPFLKEA